MILFVLGVIILALLIIMYAQQQALYDHIETLTEQWQEERSQLLDRIQAPTFSEYKNAEIKMVKAQKEEEPKPSFILE